MSGKMAFIGQFKWSLYLIGHQDLNNMWQGVQLKTNIKKARVVMVMEYMLNIYHTYESQQLTHLGGFM